MLRIRDLQFIFLMIVSPFVISPITQLNAHDTRPLYVEITETTPNTFEANWKVPITVAATNVPKVLFPQSCRPLGPVVGTKTTRRQAFQCSSDLSEEAIKIAYPRYNPSISSLVHFKRLSGEKYSEVLSPDLTEWKIPTKERTWQIARQYTMLGIEHILEGYDHLLFIICLVLLAGSFRRVLITITGFTVAHSITLAAAALDWIKVSVAPVEASIALSIVFVAMELARNQRDTLTWRYPVTVSSTFGLLHGFGFAAVLTEIGLPQTEVPTALLFFNVGVEIGQLMFVIAAVLLFHGVKSIAPKLRSMTFSEVLDFIQRPAAYVVGVLALFWTIERVTTFWS